MRTHPDPGQFVTELITDDSVLNAYLVAEVLNAQPPDVRDVLLSTSILEQASGEAARELTGNKQAAGILRAVARANGFIQPLGSGWYHYHPLFADVLRLKLRREDPDRVALLHRRAARWYERNGQLADAVRHAAQAGDWPLAVGMVIDGLAISKVIEPRGRPSLADGFHSMPHRDAWNEPQPYLVCAAVARPKAEPSGVASVRGVRRHPGSARRSRACQQQQLAGGRGHARARVGGCRRRQERNACARTRASDPWRGARPGAAERVPG